MAYESNYITFIGNLVDDPELRFTPNGSAVCNMRIASNRTWTDRNGQKQEEATFMNVNVWREYAENVAESLHKGDRVIAIGRVRVRSYENKEGQTVWVTEIEADEVAPSLRWAQAKIQKSSGGGREGGDSGGYTPPPPSDDDVPF